MEAEVKKPVSPKRQKARQVGKLVGQLLRRLVMKRFLAVLFCLGLLAGCAGGNPQDSFELFEANVNAALAAYALIAPDDAESLQKFQDIYSVLRPLILVNLEYWIEHGKLTRAEQTELVSSVERLEAAFMSAE